MGGPALTSRSIAADERQRRALEADHHADERVDRDQQRELLGVLAQPETRWASGASESARFACVKLTLTASIRQDRLDT
jgi:hypothetical protein